jgi:pantoate--beta-alanine ligase
MGALHEGHLSLIRRSKQENDRTVVSIFVNPTQFGPAEDFSKYPRNLENDCELASSAGADIVFVPEISDMYGDQPTMVHIPFVTDQFEGQARPGHFDGVATIVTKLFNIVLPTNAYFGEKDLQQWCVIHKLVTDLNFKINIVVCETIREPSGLAKSSRNVYLTTKELESAPLLYETLLNSRIGILGGSSCSDVISSAKKFLSDHSFNVDYFDLIDRRTLHSISAPNEFASLVVAARLGKTRLIDNIKVTG